MIGISSKKLWAGTLVTSAATALSLALVTASAPADSAKQGPAPAKIKMVFDGGPPSFEGPGSIPNGTPLKIVNTTKPRQIGPHTFSLIEEGSIPNSNKEFRECGKLELPVCLNVAKAHDLSNKFVVREPNVDKGTVGWDRSFSDEVKGDTWYTEKRFESETRTVSADPGTLYYFCVIHPDTMQGSISVESR